MISADGRELCFIVGHYKSGSTWLANLLSLHPEIRGVSETHVFRLASTAADLERCTHHIFTKGAWADGGLRRLARHRIAKWSLPWRVKFGLARGQSTLSAYDRPTTRLDLSVVDQFLFQRRLRAADSADDYCREFFVFLCNRLKPARYLLEKTPTNIFFIPMIRDIFPAAKLIAIYRDGRDVVVSDKFFSALENHRNIQLRDSALKWRSAIESQLRFAPEYDIHCLSYESLLASPQQRVHQILDFLQLPTEVGIIDEMIRKSSFEFVTGRSRGTSDKAFYRKGIAADWLNHFNEADMQEFSEVAGDMLIALGYERTLDTAQWKPPAGIDSEQHASLSPNMR
jgi:hypothetical protein